MCGLYTAPWFLNTPWVVYKLIMQTLHIRSNVEGKAHLFQHSVPMVANEMHMGRAQAHNKNKTAASNKTNYL